MPDRARYDVNLIPSMIAVSNGDGTTPVSLWADPTTHALVGSGSAYAAPSFVTGQQALSNAATLIVAARTARHSVTIVNLSTTDIYLGSSGVITSTGQLLLGTKGTAITLETTGAIYGIVASGTPSVSYLEEYN